ncbi:MAG: glycine cleavage system aminomethyltransferase GcvT [Planctomycetes bacterium]|nr:glycine cleavage system aminomethyltransferase GcvT [Planctomycetota bacterium]
MPNKNFYFNSDLDGYDKELAMFTGLEYARQNDKLIMIASESLCPAPVRSALTTPFINKYAEGYPSLRMSQDEIAQMMDVPRFLSFQRRYGDRRHYKGCDFANFVESLAQKRCAEIFANPNAPLDSVFVNVQPLSGAAANNAVYEAFVKPGDTVMGLALNNGGHLTHGSEFNRSGKCYKIVSYEVDRKTGKFNYDNIAELALKHRPKMIISGASAYPWTIDWKKLRQIADSVGAYLLADIAHPAGLVAAGLFPNPVGFAHATTFTTHKTLCGPRGAVIISSDETIARKIDNAVFPGEQGGPHVNTIAAKAVAFKIARTEEFKSLQKNIIENCRTLAEELKSLGFKLAYGGTDTHLLLIDLNAVETKSGETLKGDVVSNILDLCDITCNKNTIAGDVNASFSSAIRLGTTILTQRGMGGNEMKLIATLVHKVITNIDTYTVITTGGVKGRGKISQAVIDEVKFEVKKLADKFPVSEPVKSSVTVPEIRVKKYPSEKEQSDAIKNSCGLIDMSDFGLFEIRGGRAEYFFQAAVSSNIAKLRPNWLAHAFLFDDEHSLIDDLFTIRKGFDEGHSFDYYYVLSNPANAAKVRNRLQSLSDGFAFFDAFMDKYAKIDGPVVVDGLKMSALAVAGPKAAAVVKKINAEYSALEPFRAAGGQLNSPQVICANITTNPKYPVYVFLASYDEFENLYDAFLKEGASSGIKQIENSTRDSLRELFNLPVYNKKSISAKDAYKASPADFDLAKPYFAGQLSILADVHIRTEKKIFEYKSDPDAPLKRSCLYEEHLKLTKKRNIVPFAGWEMPVLYTSISDEHNAVRQNAGLFDVTHMGVFEVSGWHATRFLDVVTANYVSRMKTGQSQYSYLLDQNGDVIDDILLYRRSFTKYMVVVNAANADKDFAWLNAVNAKQIMIDRKFPCKETERIVDIKDLKDPAAGSARKVDVALQGPKSQLILRKLADAKTAEEIAKMKKSAFIEIKLEGIDVLLSRTGYTGEETGYELYLHPDDAPRMWNMILEKGREFGVQPTGLGARDSTRTEAGLPLYGHELSGARNISPVEAGYGSFVRFHKPFFVGRDSLLDKMQKSTMEVARFKMNEKGVKLAQPGDIVVNSKGQYIGRITSCTLIGETQLGMAYIEKRFASPGAEIGIFSMPKKDAEQASTKPLAQVQTGDKLPMPNKATIALRFLAQESKK